MQAATKENLNVKQGKPEGTRMFALGSAALTEGFSLIGFETLPDATPEALEELLAELVRTRQKAMIVLEGNLARGSGRWLNRVRNEGGRIVIAEIPQLHTPGVYRPLVEDLVESILGPSALEERK
jgi:vacuolar-type H+-ATPase subunit F/Vma7